MIQLTEYETRDEAFRSAGSELDALFAQHMSDPILFLSSGGSALQLVESVLPQYITDRITVTVLDERYSTDPQENNFALLTQTGFYSRVQEKGCRTIDTRVRQGETSEQLATRFEQALRDWKESHSEGIVIATMGVGPDAHISGMMPFPESKELFSKLFEGDQWVASYDASGKNPYPHRVTTTMPFVRSVIDHALVFVSGEDKKQALEIIFNQESHAIHETPGAVFHEMKDVRVHTDIET
jgi:6-phosphogluconolactonase/glucosamine-6-phosphate isomerase/deaminase